MKSSQNRPYRRQYVLLYGPALVSTLTLAFPSLLLYKLLQATPSSASKSRPCQGTPCHDCCEQGVISTTSLMVACVSQVVEQARDMVVKDTNLETAVVGEDILLTPRSPDAKPDKDSEALLAAGAVLRCAVRCCAVLCCAVLCCASPACAYACACPLECIPLFF